MNEDINVHERLQRLIERRGIILENIKYRGRLRTVKWDMYEASQKQHLFKSLMDSLK